MPKSDEMERVVILVTPEQKDALFAAADKADESMSSFVRKLIKQLFMDKESEPE